jgi:gluconate 2-dehydrogenase gamma chain
MAEQRQATPRRTFLLQAAGLAGAGSFSSVGVSAVQTATAAAAPDTPPVPYQALSPDEATFIEALVDVLCPADEYSPRGVDCGLATYIDRPLTPEEFCKAGIAAANAACLRDRSKPFDQLAPADADEFLKAVQADHVRSDGISLALWFNEVVYRLFVEACFADPMYGGNRNAVFWKMMGYPGLPANHALDMVRYRGKPFPGGKDPKSIADFT